MQYRFIGFEPSVDRGDATKSATEALTRFSEEVAKDGWEFYSIENHSTIVPGSSGCFGWGAVSPYPKTVSIAVFRK